MAIKLIVALDFDSQSQALALVDQLNPTECALKVGSELYTLLGPEFVRRVIARGFQVFLDLKFHDIPTTVARACAVGAELGVWMMNVHASGGARMMQAAKNAVDAFGATRPLLIAVTVLTSMSETELSAIGVSPSLNEQVLRLACLARDVGLDGVVSSALEVPAIKAICGPLFLTVTPGIRMAGVANDDQTRIITPAMALKAGSDYWVVGRPITRSTRPADVVRELLHDVG